MNRVLYTKYSNERSRRFALKTEILEEEGKRLVRKSALYPEGRAHVENLMRWYQTLSETYASAGWRLNSCTHTEDGAVLEYLQGQTLEEKLDDLLTCGHIEEAEAELTHLIEVIASLHREKKFTLTDGFQELFGGETGIETLMEEDAFFCAETTNLDLVCANIMMGEHVEILDYEWTFSIPIPGRFVLYRMLYYYLDKHPMRKKLDRARLFERAGITEREEAVFEKMEAGFQAWIVGESRPVRELFGMICEEQKADPGRKMQLYYELQNGINERDSVSFPVEQGKVFAVAAIPEGCRSLRLDPYNMSCTVKFLEFSFDGKNGLPEGTMQDGAFRIGNTGYFPDEDPAIEDIPVPEGSRFLRISLEIQEMRSEMVRELMVQMSEKKRLKAKTERQAQKIYEMRNTRVWRLYESLQDAAERKKK